MNKKKFIPAARYTFAKNMRKQRLKKGLSQEELAELSELHRTYVSSVERGERNISIDNIERLAIALGVDVDFLLKRNTDGTSS